MQQSHQTTTNNLKDVNIGVLHGGDSLERAGSIASGRAVYQALLDKGYRADLIDPSQDGFLDRPLGVDVAFVALHGRNGEDGVVQGLLESLGIPYTFSGVFAHALGMDKVQFKKWLIGENVSTPAFVEWIGHDVDAIAERVKCRLEFPVVIKPCSGGGSLGIRMAHDESELRALLQNVAREPIAYFAERFVPGLFVTAGVLESPEGATVLPLLGVQHSRELYDYEAKHAPGDKPYAIPAPVSSRHAEAVQTVARRLYESLGCRGAVRFDFIVNSGLGPTLLEMNTVPGMSRRGNLAAMAAATGIAHEDLVERILVTAATTASTNRRDVVLSPSPDQ